MEEEEAIVYNYLTLAVYHRCATGSGPGGLRCVVIDSRVGSNSSLRHQTTSWTIVRDANIVIVRGVYCKIL